MRSVRSISARSSSRRRWRSNWRRLSRSRVGRPRRRRRAPGLQAQRAPDPLDVDADDARALAAAPEGGDREPGEVAHLALAAVGDRLAHRVAKPVEVEPARRPRSAASPIPWRSASSSAARKNQRSKIRSKTRRSSCDFASVAAERLAEVGGLGPGHLAERLERVEDLRGPDRDALGAQLLAEGDEPRGEAGRQDRALGVGTRVLTRCCAHVELPSSPSLTPTRSATRSRSVRCLTMMHIVCSKSSESMSSAPSSSRARAQSIDSAIEGGFFRSSERTMWITSTIRRASFSSTSGECRRTISISRSTSG